MEIAFTYSYIMKSFKNLKRKLSLQYINITVSSQQYHDTNVQ